MASCEPHRSSAYSDDIRWRIVWQRHALGHTHQAIATNLNVDVSTVRQILDIFSATGTVSKKAYPAERAFRKISEPVQLFILHLLLESLAENTKCYFNTITLLSQLLINYQYALAMHTHTQRPKQ